MANEKHVAVAYGSSSAEIHSVQNQQGVVSGKNVNMNSGKDVNITGGIVTADKDTTINAGGNVNMNAVKELFLYFTVLKSTLLGTAFFVCVLKFLKV